MAKRETTEERVKETQLVIFKLREEEFAAEISSVLEISRYLEITHLPEAPGFVEGVVNLRGQVIPVIDLARQFGLKTLTERPKTARIVVAEIGGEILGILVDEVPEVLRIPENQIEPTPELIHGDEKREYVKGVAKLGERLVVVLDLEKLLRPQELEQAGKLQSKGKA